MGEIEQPERHVDTEQSDEFHVDIEVTGEGLPNDMTEVQAEKFAEHVKPTVSLKKDKKLIKDTRRRLTSEQQSTLCFGFDFKLPPGYKFVGTMADLANAIAKVLASPKVLSIVKEALETVLDLDQPLSELHFSVQVEPVDESHVEETKTHDNVTSNMNFQNDPNKKPEKSQSMAWVWIVLSIGLLAAGGALIYFCFYSGWCTTKKLEPVHEKVTARDSETTLEPAITLKIAEPERKGLKEARTSGGDREVQTVLAPAPKLPVTLSVEEETLDLQSTATVRTHRRKKRRKPKRKRQKADKAIIEEVERRQEKVKVMGKQVFKPKSNFDRSMSGRTSFATLHSEPEEKSAGLEG